MNCLSGARIRGYFLRLWLAVVAISVASSCAPRSIVVGQQSGGSTALPASLSEGPLTLNKILKARDNLSSNQLGSALRQFLEQSGASADDRREASYILARLLETSNSQA